MIKKRLPYVNAYRDRTGKLRHYLRRKGKPMIPLPGRIGSRAFLKAYELAMADTPDLMPNLSRLKAVGHIYYLEDGNCIKIGFASDLDRRLEEYATHRAAVSLLGSHPGTRADEKALHQKFSAWRVDSREWFRRNPALLEHIKRHASRMESDTTTPTEVTNRTNGPSLPIEITT